MSDDLVAYLERQMAAAETDQVALNAQQAALDQRKEEIGARLAFVKACRAAREAQDRIFSDNKDIHDALCLLKTRAHPLQAILTLHFPGLLGNRDFWLNLVKFKREFPPLHSEIFEIFYNRNPALHPIFIDKEVMVALCGYTGRAYNFIPADHALKSDSQILETTVNENPAMIQIIPPQAQRLHPGIVGDALSRLPLWNEGIAPFYMNALDTVMWNHEEVVIGWAHGGGNVHDRIPPQIRQSRAVLEAFEGSKAPTYFICLPLSADTRSNKDEMMNIVAKNPTRIQAVARELRGDVDLLLAALSHPDGMLVAYYSANFIPDGLDHLSIRSHRLLCQAVGHVRDKIYLHEVFIKLVIGSIRFSREYESFLAALNQGKETANKYMELISKFAGVPSPEELGELQSARKSLTAIGYGWEDPPL